MSYTVIAEETPGSHNVYPVENIATLLEAREIAARLAQEVCAPGEGGGARILDNDLIEVDYIKRASP